MSEMDLYLKNRQALIDGHAYDPTTERDASARKLVQQSLYVMPADGGEPHRLTGDEASYSQPRFAPDGSALYARSTPATRFAAVFRLSIPASPRRSANPPAAWCARSPPATFPSSVCGPTSSPPPPRTSTTPPGT